MPYSIYISYSMSDSSKAYDLSGKLSREKITYYLDCVESGFTLSDYTKQIIEDCEVFVALVGARYAEAKFACDTLSHAIAHGKRIIVCLVEGTPLPELLNGYTTVNEEDLLASLMGGEDNDDDNDDEDENENYRWNETVAFPFGQRTSFDSSPLTVDHNVDDELIEHRGTPPPPTQPLISEPSKKNKGCGCGCSFLAYVFVIFIIANFFVKTIFNEGLVELAIDHIETQIEKRK